MATLVLFLLVAAAPTPEALRILEQHQCTRCHEVEGLPQPPMELGCARCHIDISTAPTDPARMDRGHETYGEAWDRFVQRTGEHYTHVPALTSMSRFQSGWLRSFLLAPYDIRPNLGESMIRSNLTDREIETLIAGWAARDDTGSAIVPTPERLTAGSRAFEEHGCASCHVFGNVSVASAGELTRTFTPEAPLRALAPDLRHARDRLSRQTLEKWLSDPQSVKPNAAMPKQSLTSDDVSLLADYIEFASPGKPDTEAGRRPPPFDPTAPVPTYEEVDAKVFGVLCIHCHEEPHPGGGMMGDGGPGNTGGFGFKATGLSFESYATVMRGSLGPRRRRASVFRPGPTGEPVLLERVRQRYVENDTDFVMPGHDPLLAPSGRRSTAPRGMPLGLPALTDEQFSILERWVRGGHPGPSSKTSHP